MYSIKEHARNVREKMFANQLDLALSELESLIARIENMLVLCPAELQQHITMLLKCLEFALENRDFLTVADILEFDFTAIEWSRYDNEVPAST